MIYVLYSINLETDGGNMLFQFDGKTWRRVANRSSEDTFWTQDIETVDAAWIQYGPLERIRKQKLTDIDKGLSTSFQRLTAKHAQLILFGAQADPVGEANYKAYMDDIKKTLGY